MRITTTTRSRPHGLRTAIAAICLCLPGMTQAVADGAAVAPPPQRSEPLPLLIEEDADSQVHRIVIPKDVLEKLAGNVPGFADVAAVPPVRSIMAALAVSAAVGCGLFATRRGRPGRFAAGVLCGLALAGAGALFSGGPACADIPPRTLTKSRETRRPPVADGPAAVTLVRGGKVIVEIQELYEFGADTVALVVGTQAPAKP